MPEQIYNVDETGVYWKCLPKFTKSLSQIYKHFWRARIYRKKQCYRLTMPDPSIRIEVRRRKYLHKIPTTKRDIFGVAYGPRRNCCFEKNYRSGPLKNLCEEKLGKFWKQLKLIDAVRIPNKAWKEDANWLSSDHGSKFYLILKKMRVWQQKTIGTFWLTSRHWMDSKIWTKQICMNGYLWTLSSRGINKDDKNNWGSTVSDLSIELK